MEGETSTLQLSSYRAYCARCVAIAQLAAMDWWQAWTGWDWPRWDYDEYASYSPWKPRNWEGAPRTLPSGPPHLQGGKSKSGKSKPSSAASSSGDKGGKGKGCGVLHGPAASSSNDKGGKGKGCGVLLVPAASSSGDKGKPGKGKPGKGKPGKGKPGKGTERGQAEEPKEIPSTKNEAERRRRQDMSQQERQELNLQNKTRVKRKLTTVNEARLPEEPGYVEPKERDGQFNFPWAHRLGRKSPHEVRKAVRGLLPKWRKILEASAGKNTDRHLERTCHRSVASDRLGAGEMQS